MPHQTFADIAKAGIEEGKKITRTKATDPVITPFPTAVGDSLGGEKPAGSSGGDIIERPILDLDRPDTELERLQEERFEGIEAPTLTEIREDQRTQAQSMIDATEALFQQNLLQITREGRADLQQASSQAVSAGLAGSPFQRTQEGRVEAITTEELQAERNRRAAQIAGWFSTADTNAENKFLKEREFFASERDAEIEFQASRQLEARQIFKAFAESGGFLSDLDSRQMDDLMERTGYNEFVAEVVFNEFKPKPEQVDIQFEVVGNKIVGYYFDQATQELKTFESESFADPEIATEGKYKSLVTPDGTVLMIPENFDPNKPMEDQIQQFGEEGQFAKDETADLLGDPARIGNPTDGVYERQPSGEWVQVLAPVATPEQIAKDLAAESTIIGSTTVFEKKLQLIDEMFQIPGGRAVVGEYFWKRWSPVDMDKGERLEFFGKVQQLVDVEAIEKLLEIKRTGATLGQLSEKELELLLNSSSTINGWLIKDKHGRPTGKIEISEEAFVREVNKLKDQAIDAIAKLYDFQSIDALAEAVGGKDALSDLVEESGSLGVTAKQKRDEIRASAEETDPLGLTGGASGIDDPLGLFSSDLSKSKKGLNALASSLITQESGGNYSSVGLVPAGHSEADRALGKYQIIPKFHFGKIGLSNIAINRQKFLDSPQLQDQLFRKIVLGLAKTYNGNPSKIAAAYYGGAGGASVVGTTAGDKPQMAGGREFPSINQYVTSVLSRLA